MSRELLTLGVRIVLMYNVMDYKNKFKLIQIEYKTIMITTV